MFRSQSQRLRGINPLFSTTKEQQAQFIDPMQVNPSYLPPANDSVDPLETTTTTTTATATAIEEHGILRRGTRSATNSIVNALNSARFSFNKTKPDRRLDGAKDIDESVQEEENDLMEQDDIESMMDKMLNMDHFINNNDGVDGEESYRNNSVIGHEGLTRDSLDMVLPSNIRISVENIDGVADYNQSFDINQNVNMDFNQELNRVISMASLTPSNYDFNRMNTVAVNKPQPAGIPVKPHVQSSASSVKTAQGSSHSTNSTSNVNLEGSEPNYAALFSNMNPKKRPSRSFSIGKLTNLSQSSKKDQDTPQQQQQQEPPSPSEKYLTNNFLKIEEDDSESNLLHTPRSSMQSHVTTDDLASFDSTTTSLSTSTTEPKVRGRKPSTEYDASRTFVCKACQRRFKREEHLKRHFRSLHMHEKPFNCPKCNKKFSRTDNLTQHLKTHAD
ncbi:hypothetical protein WICPIJ_005139 [Wickerhamomyces pijperi]|uniref:C2H2-type domain-containing protein n=1 Tax=Wickerhamomyces pijperi TaxID=599730 RepID=A0A9P8Q439_WICPI|nr:hypothetical protein WICPIJ_005139 [Wickerhamomyces pijperi]